MKYILHNSNRISIFSVHKRRLSCCLEARSSQHTHANAKLHDDEKEENQSSVITSPPIIPATSL